MNVSFALEQALIEEIRAWSKNVLEESEDGLPACPYAKAAWDNDRVKLVFKHDAHKQVLYTSLSQFEDRYDVVILVDLAYEKSDHFHDYIESINDAVSSGIFIDKNLWVMGFHPDDESNENIDDGSFEPLTEVQYAMIFIQRLDKLQSSAQKLLGTGYYEKYFGEKFPEHVFQNRETYARRL